MSDLASGHRNWESVCLLGKLGERTGWRWRRSLPSRKNYLTPRPFGGCWTENRWWWMGWGLSRSWWQVGGGGSCFRKFVSGLVAWYDLMTWTQMRMVGPFLLSSRWRMGRVSCAPLWIALTRAWPSGEGWFSLLRTRRSAQLHVSNVWMRIGSAESPAAATMAVRTAMAPPVADPSVYISTWAFVSRFDCKLMFAAIACWGLRVPDIPPSNPC